MREQKRREKKGRERKAGGKTTVLNRKWGNQ
jgi:hypothetical protein